MISIYPPNKYKRGDGIINIQGIVTALENNQTPPAFFYA